MKASRVQHHTLCRWNALANSDAPITVIRTRGFIGNHLQGQLARVHAKHGATVHTLDLSGTRIGTVSLRCLFDGKAWPALRVLNLAGADMTDWSGDVDLPALEQLNVTDTTDPEAFLARVRKTAPTVKW